MNEELLKGREHILEIYERHEIHRLEQKNTEMRETPQLEWMT
jgi:hypothetical protein